MHEWKYAESINIFWGVPRSYSFSKFVASIFHYKFSFVKTKRKFVISIFLTLSYLIDIQELIYHAY